MSGLLEKILQFLNYEHIRVGALLGTRRPEVSWIVNARTELPTGYGVQKMHPALREKKEIIRDGGELLRKLAVWRKRRS
jgi:hypothetical protein